MKASELRIGNWVEIQGLESKIILVDTEGCICENEYCEDFENNNITQNLQPIPLTEEWLKRLGFEKDEEYDESGLVDYRLTLMKNSLEFVSFWNSEEITSVNQPQTGVDVKHVHQLQNLYFALTGEELNQNKENDT